MARAKKSASSMMAKKKSVAAKKPIRGKARKLVRASTVSKRSKLGFSTARPKRARALRSEGRRHAV